MKRYGKILAIMVLPMALLALVFVGVLTMPALCAGAGEKIGENTVPLARDLAAAPYGIFQAWGIGKNTKKCFDDSDDTLKMGATYANTAFRFEQDSTSRVWFLTVPSTLPSGSYLVIIRDGTDGAEAITDTEVAIITITWNKALASLEVTQSDVFVSY